MRRQSFALLVAVGLLLGACSSEPPVQTPSPTVTSDDSSGPSEGGSAATELIHVSIGNQASNGVYSPICMAVEKGFFAEQYLVVDYVNATTPVQSKALVGGQLDFYTGGVSEVILANEAGQDIVLIASLSNAMALSLYATSDFPTVQDLVGQSIGVGSVATTSYIAAQIILDYYGLTGQVSLTPITGGGPVILAALEGGQVVAAQFAPPSTAMADAQGFVEIVHGPDLDLDWVQGGVAVTRSFATENPAAVERVAAALVKTWQFVGDPANRDSVIELISRCTGATIEDSEVTYDYVHPIWQVDEKPLVSLSGMETAIKYTEGAGSQQAADQFDNSYLENS